MDDKKLIAKVKEYRELYDRTAKEYHNQVLRDNIWDEIGMKIGIPAVRCKTRWSYLRDLYSKSRKNRRLNGTVRKGKPWKYETEMAFVIPFLDKSKKSNAFQGKRSSRLYGLLEQPTNGISRRFGQVFRGNSGNCQGFRARASSQSENGNIENRSPSGNGMYSAVAVAI